MVGVPGRSKGCDTCRKRKIRCDQLRPSCSQCIKSQRECGGYERERIFHNVTASFDPTVNATAPVFSLQKGYRERDKNDSGDKAARLEARKKSPQRSDQGREVVRLTNEPSPAQCNKFSLFNLLFELYIPRERDFIGLGDRIAGIPTDWLTSESGAEQLTTVLASNRPRALEPALLSVSLAHLAQQRKDKTLMQESTVLYGEALRKFSAELAKATRVEVDIVEQNNLIKTAMTLRLYEQTGEGTTATGWLFHDKGVAHLFQARTPESFAGYKGACALISSYRSTAYFFSLVTHRKMVFDKEAWDGVAWGAEKYKTYYHMASIITPAPGLLERIYHTTDFSEQVDAMRHLHRVIKDYDTWSARYHNQSNIAQKCWYVPSSGQLGLELPENADNPFSTVFSFLTFRAAGKRLFYWTTKAVLYAKYLKTYETLSELHDSGRLALIPPPEPHWNYRAVWNLGHNIARSAEYYLSPEKKLFGQVALSPHLALARWIFAIDRKSVEFMWIERLAEKLRDRGVLLRVICGASEMRRLRGHWEAKRVFASEQERRSPSELTQAVKVESEDGEANLYV